MGSVCRGCWLVAVLPLSEVFGVSVPGLEMGRAVTPLGGTGD